MATGSSPVGSHDVFFGREDDLSLLLDRSAGFGLTFVAARPKMGKTWLLQELEARLSALPADGPGKGFLVGYHESRSGEDPLRYVLQDLYTHWLEQAPLRQQAAKVLSDQKGTWLNRVAKGVTGLFSLVGDAGGVGKAVESLMDGLIQANEKLKNGIEVPALEYDQARELMAVVAGLANRHRVLIFDAWEKVDNLASAEKLIGSFVDHPEDWPQVHIVVGVRHPNLDDKGDDPVWRAVNRLQLRSNGSARILQLQPLKLDGVAEVARLGAYVRGAVPAAAGISDQEIARMVNGFPGTLDRWSRVPGLATAHDLEQAAQDAQANRYAELGNLLRKLDPAQLTLVLRLCLLPRASAATWPLFRPVVEQGLPLDRWLECVESGLLVSTPAAEGDAYPSFGHDTRHAAVSQWFSQPHDDTGDGDYLSRLRKEANQLVVGLVQHLDFGSTSWPILSSALQTVERTATPAALGTFPRLIADANHAFDGGTPGAALLALEPWPDAPAQRRALAPFFGRSLYNSVVDVLQARKLELAWKLVALLQNLQRDFPDLLILRQRLAMILVNASNISANLGRADKGAEFGAALKQLMDESAPDTGVWREYGYALHNDLLRVGNAGDVEQAAKLLDARRALGPTPPDERTLHDFADTLKEAYAQGLWRQQTPARLAAWQAELQRLATDHPDDRYLRALAAKGLGEQAARSVETQDWDTLDGIMVELARRSREHPDEVALAEETVTVGAQVCITTVPGAVLTGRRPLLVMMRELARRFPGSTAIAGVLSALHRGLADNLRNAGPGVVPDLPQALAALDDLVPVAPASAHS